MRCSERIDVKTDNIEQPKVRLAEPLYALMNARIMASLPILSAFDEKFMWDDSIVSQVANNLYSPICESLFMGIKVPLLEVGYDAH